MRKRLTRPQSAAAAPSRGKGTYSTFTTSPRQPRENTHREKGTYSKVTTWPRTAHRSRDVAVVVPGPWLVEQLVRAVDVWPDMALEERHVQLACGSVVRDPRGLDELP